VSMIPGAPVAVRTAEAIVRHVGADAEASARTAAEAR
jgi:hypothetical protein